MYIVFYSLLSNVENSIHVTNIFYQTVPFYKVMAKHEKVTDCIFPRALLKAKLAALQHTLTSYTRSFYKPARVPSFFKPRHVFVSAQFATVPPTHCCNMQLLNKLKGDFGRFSLCSRCVLCLKLHGSTVHSEV